jgi:hypothetical protein
MVSVVVRVIVERVSLLHHPVLVRVYTEHSVLVELNRPRYPAPVYVDRCDVYYPVRKTKKRRSVHWQTVCADCSTVSDTNRVVCAVFSDYCSVYVRMTTTKNRPLYMHAIQLRDRRRVVS